MANLLTRIVISAKDEASAVFGSLQAKVAAVGAAIGAYFTTKLFGNAISSARDFEAAMSAVQAAAGASGEELAALRAAAEEAGASTKYSSVEAAGALENLAKAGLSVRDSIAALPAVLDLAAAGGLDLATSSEYITKTVSGMNMAFTEAGRVADVLAMGANASNTSVAGLAQALSYAAPLAYSLGLNLEQTVAIIGKFADAGIDASRAGTALNSILAQFSDPASKFRQELAAAGITTGNFDQALRQLAAAGPAGQRAINAVGMEAGPALRALLNQGIGSLDALKAKLDESAGSARSFAAVMSDNLDGAAKGLGSAWDALLIKLGTPVLDTLKGQISAVTERLREFVSNGTADRFGGALKSAFESAGKWAADFFSKIDFTKLAADMQAFAARAGEVFTAIGNYASAAGNAAQAAYGVMSAGANTVMAAVFKIAEAFSGVVSNILSGVALLNEGLAKISFGGVSEGFRQMAEDIRTHAGAMGAVSDEFARRASAAFDAAADGAAHAQAGFAGLAGSAQSAATTTTAALGAVAQQAKTTAERIAELREEQQRLTTAGDIDGATAVWREITRLSTEAAAAAKASGNVQRSEAEATAAKLAELREAYRAAVEAGDAQHAAQIQQQIRAELAKTVDQAQAAAADVDAAFQGLGIKSEAELKRVAENAKTHFMTIKNSGQATTNDLQAAFKVYAEAAIAANGGVATEALKAEASMQGVKLATKDAAGAVSGVGDAARDGAEGIQQLNKGAQEGVSVSTHMAEVWSAAEDSIASLSSAAARAVSEIKATSSSFNEFTQRVRGLAQAGGFASGPLDGMNNQMAELDAQAAAATSRLEAFNNAANKVGMDLGFQGWYESIGAMVELELSLINARKAEVALANSVEATTRQLDTGNYTLKQQAALLEQAGGAMGDFGDHRLEPLRGALDDVRSKLQDIRDGAQSTLASVSDDLDQINGRYVDIAKRRIDSRRDDIRAQLAEAEAAGDTDAVAALREALKKLDELAKKQIDEARTREKEEKARASEEKSTSRSGSNRPGRSSSTADSPGNAPVLGVYRVELKTRAGSVTPINVASPADASALIRELEAAAGVAS